MRKSNMNIHTGAHDMMTWWLHTNAQCGGERVGDDMEKESCNTVTNRTDSEAGDLDTM